MLNMEVGWPENREEMGGTFKCCSCVRVYDCAVGAYCPCVDAGCVFLAVQVYFL